MKLNIKISNYTDTINVYVDGKQAELYKLSLASKGTFVCEISEGVHRINIKKDSEILSAKWKKYMIFNWLSCLSGVPDWTIREMLLDTKECLATLEINATDDVILEVNNTLQGLELINKNESILNFTTKVTDSKVAKKKVFFFYIFPIILALIILEILWISAIVFLISKSKLFAGGILFVCLGALNFIFYKSIKCNKK